MTPKLTEIPGLAPIGGTAVSQPDQAADKAVGGTAAVLDGNAFLAEWDSPGMAGVLGDIRNILKTPFALVDEIEKGIQEFYTLSDIFVRDPLEDDWHETQLTLLRERLARGETPADTEGV